MVPKREIAAATDAPPPPTPKAAPKKKQETKRDMIAEALKKEDAKQPEQKKAEATTPLPPKRPPQQQPQPKFDPNEVAALLDKRAPQRLAATGDVRNDTVALGARGTAAQLSQNELDALRARLAQLWNPPAGASNPQELVVAVRMRLEAATARWRRRRWSYRPDKARSTWPRATAPSRAVFRGQPFDMLRAETYEQWKDIEITFDPREMIRGATWIPSTPW